MHRKPFSKKLTTSLLLIAILLSGCSKKENTPIDPIPYLTLGVIFPMDQDMGTLPEKALLSAIDAINESGGVGDGLKLLLEIRSSAGDDREAVAAKEADAMIQSTKNLVGFVTALSSESKGLVEQVAIPLHYPVISGGASSGYLTGISSYFQRLCPPDNFEANILAQQAVNYGITKVAIAVESGDLYSEDLANAFQEEFGTGVEVQVKFQPDDPAYTSKLVQLLEGEPEALLICMLNPATFIEFIAHLDEISSQGGLVNTSIIICDGMYTNSIFDAPVDFMIGEVNGRPKNFGAMPSADTASGPYIYFKTQLADRYQMEPGSYTAQFYDVGFIYAMAIEKALAEGGLEDMGLFRDRVNYWIRQVSHGNPADPLLMPSLGWKSMRSACRNGGVNYTGASGNCDIDNQGNCITPYALFQIVQGPEGPEFKITSVFYPE